MTDAGPPAGFGYFEGFLSVDEERGLLERFGRMEFAPVEMRGVVAKRTVLHFGFHYGYQTWQLERGEPFPSWLEPLRLRAEALPGASVDGPFSQALLSRYPPGAGIGWHRDAPMFGAAVVGISLGAPCRFRMKHTDKKTKAVRRFALELQPRSAYVLGGEARTLWQHSIPDQVGERYSITFRSVKAPRSRTRSPGSRTPT